jgi:hypothetical protein
MGTAKRNGNYRGRVHSTGGNDMSWFAWTLAFIGAAWLSWAIVKGVEALGR